MVQIRKTAPAANTAGVKSLGGGGEKKKRQEEVLLFLELKKLEVFKLLVTKILTLDHIPVESDDFA